MLWNVDVNVFSLRVNGNNLQVNTREKTIPKSAYKRNNLPAFDTTSIESNIKPNTVQKAVKWPTLKKKTLAVKTMKVKIPSSSMLGFSTT